MKATETYLSGAGAVRGERHLYRPAGRQAKSICPVELRAGIRKGDWPPRAARHGAVGMAQLAASQAEARFAELGELRPSRSTLARLPRPLSVHWEAHRTEGEAAGQAQETGPSEATTLALSVDGGRAPRNPHAAARVAKRAAAGKHASGPPGYREVGCGTVTRYDEEGARLQTSQSARMPDPKKGTLGQQLQAEAHAILGARPDLQRGYLADGAETHWQLLAETEQSLGPTAAPSWQLVDFYHAGTHLNNGCAALWGQRTVRGQAEFARLRLLLKEADDGAERILRTLRSHASRATRVRRKRIRTDLPYFRNQPGRRPYAVSQRHHLPSASGGMEAACKTLVPQRRKGSGRAWTPAGGHASLTLRSLRQSGRGARAWPVLAADFRAPVVISDDHLEASLPLAAYHQALGSRHALNLGEVPISLNQTHDIRTVPHSLRYTFIRSL